MEQEQQTNNWLLWAVVIIVAAVVLWLALRGSAPEQEIEVDYLDITAENEEDRVSSALPEGLPLELTSLNESYVAASAEVDQHTASYESDATVEEKAEEYRTYLIENDYTLVSDQAETGFVSLFAQKDGNDLSILISDQGEGVTLVQITYLEHKQGAN